MAFDPSTAKPLAGGFDPSTAKPAGQTLSAQAPEPLSAVDQFLAKINIPTSVNQALDKARGFAMGMADPVVGAVQLAANVAGSSDKDSINKSVQQKEAEYQQTRALRGDTGFDPYRMAGAVASPTNLVGAGWLAKAATVPQMVMKGGALGGAMGLAQPVAEPDNYVAAKAGQTIGGAAGGAFLTPVASKVMGGLSSAVSSLVRNYGPASTESASAAADKLMGQFIEQARAAGLDAKQLSDDTLTSIRNRVTEALRAGKSVDPSQLVRTTDFETVGVLPTAGQITRDPMQFAQERNLRGIDLGNGQNPLAQRFSEQGRTLRNIFSEGENAPDKFQAGSRLSSILREGDQPRQQAINQAYQGARNEAGRYADVNVPVFSEQANRALDEKMLGRFLPEEVKGLMNDISTGKLPLNVNNLVQVDSVMSAAQRKAASANDKAAANAIGQVRNALNNAPLMDSARKATGAAAKAGDVNAPSIGEAAKDSFDKARAMARERFARIERTPALESALNEDDPEKFVAKHIIGATTQQLRSLADEVGQGEARGIVRGQILQDLRQKAFGQDVTGDAPFAAERFNKAIQSMGRDKLLTFFSPEEVSRLQAAGRVMGYIKTQPEGSAVNNSNTGSAVSNAVYDLLGKLGSIPGINLARGSVRAYQGEKAIGQALNPSPSVAAPPSATSNRLKLLLSGVPAFSAGISGEAVR